MARGRSTFSSEPRVLAGDLDGRKVRGMLGHAVLVRSAATPGAGLFQTLLGGCIILPVLTGALARCPRGESGKRKECATQYESAM